MYDAGLDVMAHMRVIHAMSSSTQCQPIIASLRNAQQMVDIASIGHTCFKISPSLARNLFDDELTQKAILDFELIAEEGKP